MNLGSSGFIKVDSLQWHLALAGRIVYNGTWLWLDCVDEYGFGKAAIRWLCDFWVGLGVAIGGRGDLG